MLHPLLSSRKYEDNSAGEKEVAEDKFGGKAISNVDIVNCIFNDMITILSVNTTTKKSCLVL